MNKTILVGNLGADVEVRSSKNGQSVANFRMATTEKWTDKNGEKKERTEWHRIVVWGKLAELCGQYLSKGRKVMVEGKLQTREWTDTKDNIRRFTTEILAQQVEFLDSKRTEQKVEQEVVVDDTLQGLEKEAQELFATEN